MIFFSEEYYTEGSGLDSTLENVAATASSVNVTFAEQFISFINWFKAYLTRDNIFKITNTLIIIFIIYLIYKAILNAIKKIPAEKITSQRSMFMVRFIKYTFYIIELMYILSLFGIKLSAIWGAAGIAGIAIGFAAQTSVSNLISGLFVITEGSLKIGDTIIVDGITGVVDEINLISVRIHTFDNQMVRIPNSTIINTNLTNNSFHNKRRITLTVPVSYDTDLTKALEVLSKAPTLCPTILNEPAPSVWFDGFGDRGINIVVAGWFDTKNTLKTKNDLYIAIKKVLDEAQIEIPYNKLNVKGLDK